MNDTQKQPASVPVELSDDLLWKWFKESLKRRGLHDFDFCVLRDVADKAAAYGREQGQWVPVSERLPDDDAKVIYSSPYVGVRQGRYIADGCEFSSRGGLLHYSDVTHWMPLPEPPTC